jgi:CDP-diacylglycerol--serine O-phosphatidyltransferase
MVTDDKKERRGIYLLPNLFTTAGLFSGFYAIVASMRGDFEPAAVAIFIAMIMDGLDGRIARMTNTQSAFGAEYDSLTDMVAFGLAPALVMFQWSLITFGKIGWMVAFIYAACAALRLARFNTQLTTQDKRYFQGLPSPASAACVAGLIWLGSSKEWDPSFIANFAIPLTFLCGVLMVSSMRYYSFKELDFKNTVPFVWLIAIVLLFALIHSDPPLFLFAGFMIYAVSGPTWTLLKLRQHRQERAHTKD